MAKPKARLSDDDVRRYYATYPPVYAACRTFRHGPEVPFTVERPPGRIRVTRLCQCGRLVTKVYTPDFVQIPRETEVRYPADPPYLALPGMGGVDRAQMAEKAIAHELAEISRVAEAARLKAEAETATRAAEAEASKPTAKPTAKRPSRSRKPPTST